MKHGSLLTLALVALAAVPNAQVTVSNERIGRSYAITTNERGE